MNTFSSKTISEALITLDLDEGILFCTEKAENIFIKSLGLELRIGSDLLEIFDVSLRSSISAKLEECKSGKVQSLILDYNTQKYSFVFSPVLNGNSLIKQVSIVVTEVADDDSLYINKEAKDEQRLRRELEYNKQVYSNLFYNNPDAVFSFDLEGNFVDANAQSALLAETTHEELMKMHFLPFIEKEDHERVLENFYKARLGENQSYVTRFISVKGTEKILEINNFPISYNNEIVGVYGIAKDITDKRRTENKILEEREMLKAIIDNIPDYIFVKDRKHKNILANRKFYKQILGKENEDETIGFSPLDYFDEERGELLIADNEKVMNSGTPVINRPDTVVNIQGKKEQVLLTKVPLHNHNKEIVGLVGIARDITETYLHNKKQELIFQVIKAFGDKPTFQEAMFKVLKIFGRELGYENAEAYKVSVNNEKLVRIAHWPKTQDPGDNGKIFEKGTGLPGIVWSEGKVRVVRYAEEPELFDEIFKGGELAIKSAVGVPIIYQDQLISIFCLGSTSENKKIETDLLGDITIQIASAMEHRRSQQQLNDFFDYSPNLIAVVGLDGFIKKINPSFENKFGYSEDEILTKPFTDFIHPDDLGKTYEAIEKLSVDGSDFEIRCLKKDGQYLWISWRFSQFFEKENVIFVYGTDITPLKTVHKELEENISIRKVTQQKLEESEKKYRSLFDASPLPMWVLERSSLRFLKVNKAAIDLYGFTENEFSNMTVKDLWAPNQEDRIEKIVSENKNEFFQVKVKHIKKNGEFIYVNVNSNPVIFDGLKARVSLIKNITDRIKAEEKLLHREQRFKALVQDGSDLITIVDSNYDYKYSSPASKAVFGIEPSDLNKTNFRDHIHKDDLNMLEEHLLNLRSQKRVQLPSYRVKSVHNNWRWIETIITNLQDDPAIEGMVMNSRDITEFVEQEQELLESLRRYDIVAKATSDIITDYDIEKGEMKVGVAAFKKFGYQNKTGIYSGEWWNEKLHPDDIEHVKSAEKKMVNGGLKNLTIEYRFRCADGSYKYILDRSYLITDDKNNPKRVIGSMQDITERKRHLIAIENHNKRLKEIAWTQSHLVRAPLAKVMGLVDLLLNYKNDLENVDELLEKILISANELDGIIRQIASQTEKEL